MDISDIHLNTKSSTEHLLGAFFVTRKEVRKWKLASTDATGLSRGQKGQSLLSLAVIWSLSPGNGTCRHPGEMAEAISVFSQ